MSERLGFVPELAGFQIVSTADELADALAVLPEDIILRAAAGRPIGATNPKTGAIALIHAPDPGIEFGSWNVEVFEPVVQRTPI